MIYSDPIHGAVRIPDFQASLLNLAPLIRLRNIRQLGFTPSVNIGAVHTRFEHTVGKTGVLMALLKQLGVDDRPLTEKFVKASLLGEIGTFPFSFSTRWLFARCMEMSKRGYGKLLADTFIAREYSLTSDDTEFIWADSSHPDHCWFREIPAFAVFPELTALRLADAIDYAMRDAHYSGRYSNSFDYRHFRTLVDITSPACHEQLKEGVRELYRSIHALDAVYGHASRRFLVLLFTRLSQMLTQGGYLDLSRFKEAATYVELDDDRFMSELRKATETAHKDGCSWVMSMMDSVEQLMPVDIVRFELTSDTSNLTFLELEQQIADDHGVKPEQVIVFSDSLPSEHGYVLFGRPFDSYREAIDSEFFKGMTGLSSGSNRTGLLDDKAVHYTIVQGV
jgi:HD superfamily phosphohydrolase